MTLGFEREGRFYRGRKKEPGSHFYMCLTEHDVNYHNLPTHALDRQPHIGLELLFLIDTIIQLSKELSMLFCIVSKTYCGVKESQIARMFN